MEEKINEIWGVCSRKENLINIVKKIQESVKLNEQAIPKCVQMVRETMKKNINRLDGAHSNKNELKCICLYLNKLCANQLIQQILKRHPEALIKRNKHVSKEQMRREIDLVGHRENFISPRSHHSKKKEESYDMDMDNNSYPLMGIDSFSGSNTYAPALSSFTITNISDKKDYSSRNPNLISSRMEDMINQRRMLDPQDSPPEIDLSLDGSGRKRIEEKNRKSLNSQNPETSQNPQNPQTSQNSEMNPSLLGMYGGLCDSNPPSQIDPADIYESIFGKGAPRTEAINTNSNVSTSNSNIFMQLQPPAINVGMGNPLMGISTSNGQYTQQNPPYANNDQNLTMKSIQLNNSLEQMMNNRKLIDIETNQPVQSDNNQQASQSFNMYSNPNQMNFVPISIPNYNFNYQQIPTYTI